MRLHVTAATPAYWKLLTIERVCERVTSGGTPSRQEASYYGGDIPWVKTKELNDTWLSTSEEQITQTGLANSSAKLLPANTVLMAMYGATVGKLALLAMPMTCNQAACAMVVDPRCADFRYLFYQLQYARPQICDLANGAAQQNLSAATIKSLEVPFPSLDEQRAIAQTLGALDDKIESNRRLATLVPQLIRAKVEVALGADSEEVSVSSLAQFINGGAFTKGASGSGRMVLRIAELNSGPGASTVYNDIDVPDEKLARRGDILMSWSGSLGVYRWYRDEAIVNQHIFKVIPTDYPAWLVFDRLEAVIGVFQNIAKDKATTMGHIQRGDLVLTTVAVPSDGSITAVDAELSSLWDRLLLAEHENTLLEALRDALLPGLLSGRIRAAQTFSVAEAIA